MLPATMESSLTCALVFLFLLFLIYYTFNVFVFKTWNYFTNRGVVFDRGLPIFGSFAETMFGRASMAETQIKLYKRYSQHKFVGVYQMGGRPMYLVKDPELIKAITVTDFDHFMNHNFEIDTEIEPLMGRVLINISDETWRELRSILSPLFTGSKMRTMLPLMGDTIEDFISGVKEEVAAAGPNNGVEYNLSDLYMCSTNDTIVSGVFGIKLNSFKDKNNEFYAQGKSLASAIQSPKMFFIMCFPMICKWLRIKLISDVQTEFFRKVIRTAVEERKTHGVVRNDMIHLLMLLRDAKLDSIAEKKELQDAGFATTAEFISTRAAEKLKSK